MNELLCRFPERLRQRIPVAVPPSAEHRIAANCLGRLLADFERPWGGPLALGGLLSLRAVAANSAYQRTLTVSNFFRRLFTGRNLTRFDEFEPDLHFAVALAGRLPGMSVSMAANAIYAYRAVGRDVGEWLDGLDRPVRCAAAGLLLPPFHDLDEVWRHLPSRAALHPLRGRIEHDRAALIEAYPDLAGAIEERWLILRDLSEACRRGETDPVVRVGASVHRFSAYKLMTGGEARLLLHYRGGDGAPLWFVDLLANRLLVKKPGAAKPSVWLKERGLPSGYFQSIDAGLLRPVAAEQRALGRVPQPAFALQPLVAAALVGRVAVNLLLDRGPRIMELRQFAFEAGRLSQPNRVDQLYRFRAVAKGGLEREFEFGERSAVAVADLVRFLRRHYRLPECAPLPRVPFHGRKNFGERRYLFQLNRRHLAYPSMLASIRFLAHGLAGDGTLNMRPHLLRHAYANAAAEAGVPVERIAQALNHADTSTTILYTAPTDAQALGGAIRWHKHLGAQR
ncbi:MAG: site-specific integrase [Alphaproteobacteria bacterium]|nr:site-specific integrase [Alphaproteobacteria bacterium]